VLHVVCVWHAGARRRVLTIEELTARLGAPVAWLAMDEVLRAHVAVAAQLLRAPARHRVGQVADLAPGEVGHVFQEQLHQDAGGLWISERATLVRPFEGGDVPLRRRGDGGIDALLEGLLQHRPWQGRRAADDVAVHGIGETVAVAPPERLRPCETD
jgi:hypothetical protein